MPHDRDRGPSMRTLLQLAKQADLLDQPEIQELLTAAAASDSAGFRRRVEEVLEVQAARRQAYPFREDGDYVDPIRLGVTPTGSYIGLDEADLTQHVLTAGQSGAGKTTLFYNLMDQVSVPWWAFDLKQDYRHLVSERSDLLVLPWQELRFNPLEPPPGVPEKRWAQVFAEVFGHATGLLSGSKNFLMKHLVGLYRERDNPPTLHSLLAAVRDEAINYMRTSSNYQERVLNRIEPMLLTAGDIFEPRSGYISPHLLDRDVVFEFDGLSNDLQNFLMETLFSWVFEYRLQNSMRNDGLQHLFFLDEGKRIFSVYKERQDASGIPTIDELTAKMREFGEGLVVADQEPTKLTDSIKANTYVKILLAMGDYRQFNEVAESMDLQARQRDIAQQLDTGEAVVQIGNSDPVPVSLDQYDLSKSVSDVQLTQVQQPHWDELEAIFGDREKGEQTTDNSLESKTEGEQKEERSDLSEGELKLLKDVNERPFAKIRDRYKKLSSTNAGDQAKQGLLDKGLIREQVVREEQGHPVLLELTKQGREVLGSHGVDVSHEGRGSVVHRYWQHKVCTALESLGWSCEIEEEDADVSLARDGSSVAVEVAMGANEREVDHVDRRLSDGFDCVVVGCRGRRVREEVEEMIEERGVDTDAVDVLRLKNLFGSENGLLDLLSNFDDS